MTIRERWYMRNVLLLFIFFILISSVCFSSGFKKSDWEIVSGDWIFEKGHVKNNAGENYWNMLARKKQDLKKSFKGSISVKFNREYYPAENLQGIFLGLEEGKTMVFAGIYQNSAAKNYVMGVNNYHFIDGKWQNAGDWRNIEIEPLKGNRVYSLELEIKGDWAVLKFEGKEAKMKLKGIPRKGKIGISSSVGWTIFTDIEVKE